MEVARSFFRLVWRDSLGRIGLVILGCFLIIALCAPYVVPYDPMEMIRKPGGSLARLLPPSREHLFGTTDMARDLFSQVIMGTRVALLVGLLAAVMVGAVGVTAGLVAGYYGGWIDNLLMRLVDMLYGIPLIPFVVILSALVRPSLGNMVLAMSLLSWRSVARVVRSQTLSVSQRPFVKAARVAGASDFRIMFVHVAPNVLPVALVEMSFIVGWAIVTEASVSFVGFGDPAVVSWGKILHQAFITGAMRTAWWWVLPPGIAIVLLVISVFFLARTLEELVNPRLRRQKQR
ncbi:MAG: ABC transporter permease [Bacillota bacterium]